MDLAAKLEKLAIDEVSGVDHPANLIGGFMVMKARSDCPVHARWDDATGTLAIAVEGAGAISYAREGIRTDFDAHGAVVRVSPLSCSAPSVLPRAGTDEPLFLKNFTARTTARCPD